MSTEAGKKAEASAANYLVKHGFTIVDRNWKTRWCEVDIIAGKQGRLYFVEVKYRRTVLSGGGLDYITPTKLRRMQRASDMWVASNDWHGDYCLAAMSLTGEPPSAESFTVIE